MNTFQAIFLGVIQGITEFLPISSSGHLVILQRFFGITEPVLLFDVVVHIGTLFAVLIFLRNEIKGLFATNPFRDVTNMRNWGNIIIALIPTGIIGLGISKRADYLFGSTTIVGIMLLLTAFILLLPGLIVLSHSDHMNFRKAFLIGVAQGVAVIPGISRSGITIVTALLLGIRPETAGRFSFLISCPAIVGALGLELLKWHNAHNGGSSIELGAYFAGFLAAFLVGYISLNILMWVIKRGSQGRLQWFSPYCALIGLLLIIFG